MFTLLFFCYAMSCSLQKQPTKQADLWKKLDSLFITEEAKTCCKKRSPGNKAGMKEIYQEYFTLGPGLGYCSNAQTMKEEDNWELLHIKSMIFLFFHYWFQPGSVSDMLYERYTRKTDSDLTQGFLVYPLYSLRCVKKIGPSNWS